MYVKMEEKAVREIERESYTWGCFLGFNFWCFVLTISTYPTPSQLVLRKVSVSAHTHKHTLTECFACALQPQRPRTNCPVSLLIAVGASQSPNYNSLHGPWAINGLGPN